MSRLACVSIVLASLVAAPGCGSCFGGLNCRRPSFLEFGTPCGSGCGTGLLRGAPAPACAPACGPACEPAACEPSAAPCCEGAVPGGTPVPQPAMPVGTFS
ncbi:MAG: hypothetical protein ACKOCW_12220 [Planctomycetaceae bacterium]